MNKNINQWKYVDVYISETQALESTMIFMQKGLFSGLACYSSPVSQCRKVHKKMHDK